jgi:cell division protein FtsI (penicillin-binding protein 3)
MALRNQIVTRSGIVYFMMLLVAFVILGSVVYMQVVEREKWEEMSDKYIFRISEVPASRGDILAHDGRLLASSVPHYNIRMDTRASDASTWNNGIDGLASGLSRMFGDKSAAEWKKSLNDARKSGNRYFLVKRRVDYETMLRMKRLPIFREGQYRGGMIAEVEDMRVLLNQDLAARTIGYVNLGEEVTAVGIEGAFNPELAGTNGVAVKQRLTGGDWITVRSEKSLPSVNGSDVLTTIDIDLQDVASSALEKQLIKHDAHHGCAVVMEVKTGDIRAIVNLEQGGDGNYRERYNYAIGESTEPGSTFKLPVMMAALEDGLIDTSDIVDTGEGVVEFYGKKIRDSKEGGFGRLTVKEVFENSSNVGTSKVITQVYKDNPRDFVDRLYSFGLNEKLGIQLVGEGEPLIRYPGDKLWSGLTLPQMSYGYEVMMTPLQILTFYNAVANDGKLVKPRFVSAIMKNGQLQKQLPVIESNRSLASKSTIEKVKIMMEGVVERGTAMNLRNTEYKIAGKTGTAQIANANTGYRSGTRMLYQASFVGYFPAENPLYSIIVVVNAPSNGVYYGNIVAGTVFREISDKIYATRFFKEQEGEREKLSIAEVGAGYMPDLNIVLRNIGDGAIKGVDGNWASVSGEKGNERYTAVVSEADYVPDVTNMSLRDAMFFLEDNGYRVRYSGKGKVKRQSPEPGTKYYRGQIVALELRLN